MTSTHNDPVEVKPAVQISVLLTRIAARMFDGLATRGATLPLSHELFEAWNLIRKVAHLCATHGDQVLEDDFEFKLADALILAHRVYHGGGIIVPCPGQCDCEMARWTCAAANQLFRTQFAAVRKELHETQTSNSVPDATGDSRPGAASGESHLDHA